MSARRSPRSKKHNQSVSAISRLRPGDLLLLATAGLRARPTRAVLSALGIAIGIAAMIAVVGISASSQQRMNAQLAQLGTNLLSVQPGKSPAGKQIPLPTDSAERIRRIPGVQNAAMTAVLEGVNVYRNRMIDAGLTSGITVHVAALGLLDTVDTRVSTGSWLSSATASYPTVVLGVRAANRLGVTEPGKLVWLGGRNVTVIGILQPAPLVPELDSAALIGTTFAARDNGWSGHPTTVYERSTDETVAAVRKLIGPSIQPETPGAVAVSRPSDALAAKNAVDETFTLLLLALGSIALLVGGIGVANTMVISVLERRREIGLRRALGATRRHIRLQFLAEALLLSALGGIAGVALGSTVSTIIAVLSGWVPVIPIGSLAGGVCATVLIGAIAGLYPAVRAARTPPTVALNG